MAPVCPAAVDAGYCLWVMQGQSGPERVSKSGVFSVLSGEVTITAVPGWGLKMRLWCKWYERTELTETTLTV